MQRLLSIMLLATAGIGCGPKNPDPANFPLGQSESASGSLAGAVLEQLSAPPYVYLRIKTSKGDVWAAVPEAPVVIGAAVTVLNPMLMAKFESKSLNRTFDEVYFGTLASAGAAATGTSMGTPPSPAVDVGKVEKATGADARTVAEVWAQKASLVGKTVTIRGVVVKANDGVMGKNWIHLQDGSGDAARGTNDITVTSLDLAAKGETVTITGTVRTDRDFGAGYVYAVIVEDAKVIKK